MSPAGSSIVFEHSTKNLDRKRLRAFHKRLLAELTQGAAFNCLLTGDDRLRQLNRDFLQHDYSTDVLSFPQESAPGPHSGCLGDLAISQDRAAEQARTYNHTVETEIEILMLHGALHLMGMDHEIDKGKMARAESGWRRKLGLPHTLIGRTRKQR